MNEVGGTLRIDNSANCSRDAERVAGAGKNGGSGRQGVR